MLYLVPMPISQESRWTFSAEIIDVLNQLDALVCERIRTTRRFISPHISKDKLNAIAFYELDKHSKQLDQKEMGVILTKYAKVGLSSEAGMPCIADPGWEVCTVAHQMHIPVVPIVGPNSMLLALMASGLNGQNFHFSGYLPFDKREQKIRLSQMQKDVFNGITQIFMDTPYRNAKLFDLLMHHVNPSLRLCIALNLNSPMETITCQTIDQWQSQGNPFSDKAPCVFVLGK